MQTHWLTGASQYDEEYGEFAEALVLWIQTNYGFLPDYFNVINEPGSAHFTNGPNELVHQGIAAVNHFESRGWNNIKMAFDEAVIPSELSWQLGTCSGTTGCVDKVGLVTYHGYDYNGQLMPTVGEFGNRNTARDTALAWSSQSGLNVLTGMTEICCGAFQGGQDGSYFHGLQVARDIYWNMLEGNISMWMPLASMTPCSSTGCATTGGDPIAIETGPAFNDWYKFSNYYAQRQFSHYIRPDDVRVEVTCSGCTSDSKIGLHTKSVAFKKPNGNHVAVVINDKTSSQIVNLAGFPAGTYNIEGIDPGVCIDPPSGAGLRDRCTPSKSSQTISAGQNLVLTMPAQAIITFEQVSSPSPDTTPPVITSVAESSVSSSSATITWTTDEASNSSVDYGTTTSLGTLVSDASLLASHSTQITGLSSTTQYFYAVTSCDASGNCATSSSKTSKSINSPSQLVPSTIKLTICPSIVELVFQNALVKEHLGAGGDNVVKLFVDDVAQLPDASQLVTA